MKSLFIILLASFLVTFIQAFCIYNDSRDNSFFVRQMPLNTGGLYGARFRRESLSPGDHACCNYKTTDCNKNGNPDDIVIMAFQAILDGKGKNYMFTVSMTAGGYMELGGGGLEDPTIKVFNVDGTSFNFEYQISPRGIMLN